MELATNRKLTALQTDNVGENCCYTVYSFGIYCFYMQSIWISNTFSKTLHYHHCICTYNWTITARKSHGWCQLSQHIASPGPAGEVLQGGQLHISSSPSSYWLFSKPFSASYLLPTTLPFMSTCLSSRPYFHLLWIHWIPRPLKHFL